jgi:hypothetical protein
VTGHVDWADVERRHWRWNALAMAGVVLTLAAWLSLLRQPWPGWISWAWLAVLALFGVGQLLVSRFHPGRRAKTTEGFRAAHALRHHLDPGPGARERADRVAAWTLAMRWLPWWLFLLIPLGALLAAEWSRPARTVPAAVVVVASFTALALLSRRSRSDARRWVDRPPGPERTVELSAADRRRRRLLLALLIGLLVLALVLVVVVVLVALG